MASRTPANLVSLPSLSSSLNALPHATSLAGVALHPNMYANRAAESEAKLQRVLDKQAAALGSQPQTPLTPNYAMSNSAQQHQDSSSPLMMRKKKFTM